MLTLSIRNVTLNVLRAIAQARTGEPYVETCANYLSRVLDALNPPYRVGLVCALLWMEYKPLLSTGKTFGHLPVLKQKKLLDDWARSSFFVERDAVAFFSALMLIAQYDDRQAFEASGLSYPAYLDIQGFYHGASKS